MRLFVLLCALSFDAFGAGTVYQGRAPDGNYYTPPSSGAVIDPAIYYDGNTGKWQPKPNTCQVINQIANNAMIDPKTNIFVADSMWVNNVLVKNVTVQLYQAYDKNGKPIIGSGYYTNINK